MYYEFAVTIPAGTTATAPHTEELKLTAGIIHQFEIEFPDGPNGQVSLKIEHLGNSYLPTNPDGAFVSDGHSIVSKEHYELSPGANILKAVGWAPNAVYDHTIRVRIGVLRPEDLEPTITLVDLLKRFFRLVGIVK